MRQDSCVKCGHDEILLFCSSITTPPTILEWINTVYRQLYVHDKSMKTAFYPFVHTMVSSTLVRHHRPIECTFSVYEQTSRSSVSSLRIEIEIHRKRVTRFWWRCTI